MTLCPRPSAPRRVLAVALAGTLMLGHLTPLQAQQPRRAAAPATAKVTVNFVNADIEAVSRAMAAIVKRQILVDPRVRGQMTLYSEQPLTEREAFLNYLSVLRGLGFTVVDVAGLLKVVPEAEAKLQTGTVSVGNVVRTGDQILTQVFPLKHENVNNLVTVLRPLITPNNTINANPGTNSLVITDYADNLQRLGKIVAALDLPSGTDIEAVSRAMAAIVKRQILVDPRVRGQMTLYSEQPLTEREAFLNYLSVLRGLGFTVVDVAGLLKVVPEAEAKLQTGTVSVGNVMRTGDQILTQVFPLKHENVNNLVTVLRPLITPNNTINANPGNNTLVITDYADNLQRLSRIIAALDTPAATDVEVIPVKNGSASDLAPMVQRFADSSSGGTPGAPAAMSGGVSIMADPRTNSLLVRAPNAARLAVIRAVIDKLDRPGPPGGPAGNIYVVYLKNADATRLAAVLRAAYGAGGGGASGGSTGGASTGLGATSASSGGGMATAIGGQGGSGASAQSTTPVSASASPSTGGFVQADPATNALIITAPEPVYRQLRAVIDQLDARRAQVYVESMIVKMDASQAAEFGFQWQGLLGKSGDKYGVIAGTNYSATSGAGSNLVTLSQSTTSTGVNLGAGLNVGLIQALNGIYTLGALARFLESSTGANILSTPNLVALDNEEAKIVIGQNVPFITGSFTNTGTSNGSANPFQTIERKDVGLTLRIKPQIGENGTVRMQIYQENSSVIAGTTSSSAGPSTEKSSIETSVVVDDGQIMVLGGLLKDEYADGEDRVPGLASIPLFGNLFKAQNRKRIKTNLLVFLRPVVMRTQEDANTLTMDRYDLIRARQQDGQPKPSQVLGINEAPVLPELRRGERATPTAPSASTPGR